MLIVVKFVLAISSLLTQLGMEQAYVMVSVLDNEGRTITGFEADKCVFRNDDRRDIPLKWGDTFARELAGKTIRLRFFFRSASIYAVTGKFER